MPENQIPATQPEPGAEPGEFSFAKPPTETPRIKRRSLKSKQAGLIKPTGSTPTAARELEREAPPLTPAEVVPAKTHIPDAAPAKSATSTIAPPRTTPSVAAKVAPSTETVTAIPASASSTAPASSASSIPGTSASIRSTATPTTSPHGTRPATLYYSSPTRKAETPSPMKTIPTAGPSSSSSTTTAPSSTTRPAATTTIPSSTTRPATTTSTSSTSRPTSVVDYRANVERQSREQKSVGSILSYVVYALIAIFVVGALLAGYGANVIFERIHDQSVTVTELDSHYASANKDLNTKLAALQDTLSQQQAQIARQQDLIVKQQDAINKLINAANDDAAALKLEKQMRTQETINLRARARMLEAEINQLQPKP